MSAAPYSPYFQRTTYVVLNIYRIPVICLSIGRLIFGEPYRNPILVCLASAYVIVRNCMLCVIATSAYIIVRQVTYTYTYTYLLEERGRERERDLHKPTLGKRRRREGGGGRGGGEEEGEEEEEEEEEEEDNNRRRKTNPVRPQL